MMERLTIPDVRVDEHTTRRTMIDGEAVREHAMDFYWRLKAYEDTGLTPKELSEFKTLCRVDADCCACPYYNYTKMDCDGRVIGRPPQSWCYVEAMKDA